MNKVYHSCCDTRFTCKSLQHTKPELNFTLGKNIELHMYVVHTQCTAILPPSTSHMTSHVFEIVVTRISIQT